MTTVAFFGAGLLGTGFVRALRRKDVAVNVWNRTASKASALEADGAKAFAEPADAARGAERIHLSLSDDAAVNDVLERALPGMKAGISIVDHTTTSAAGTTERVKRWSERGFSFVHAPVMMGPQNALESTGLMFVSGERARVDAVRPHIETMTGKVIDVGERPDAAAAHKLMANLFLMFFTSGLAEMFTLSKSLGIEPKVAAEIFTNFNPGLTISARIDRMLNGDLTKPGWELAMARKDARLMLEEGKDLKMLPAIAARMDELIAEGLGNHDWTILAKGVR